ncbi:winged helix-turn-helix domain-containing protein [Dyella choica]|uniref:ArsR family transcriptional regulator n=1 Tax=Dyella choica TaxID=1927959 RepID=A0A432LZE4_9GAMM|nr:helix-turn-helix domain-containing protein [Dyella choica]RUL69009.1 ArsR family transcriptional regulator [Dyella choica]
MSKQPNSLNLTPAQLKVMASSMRLAILQHLEAEGEATTKELATQLERPATALYHHLDQLVRHGLIRVAGQRETERRPEAVYALVSRQLSSSKAVRTPSGRKALIEVASRVLASSLRAFSAAVAQAAARLEGPGRHVAIRHLVFRADRQRLMQINEWIDSLENMATSSSADGEGMLLTIVMAPRAMPGHRPVRRRTQGD